MSSPRNTTCGKLEKLRDSAITVLIGGGAQILLALLVWPIVFRRAPLGLSLALSLVGFGNWVIAALFSFRLGALGRRMARREPTAQPASFSLARMKEQTESAGCGFLLFLSSLVPLGLAFVIRVRADLARGLTWQDLFPPLP